MNIMAFDTSAKAAGVAVCSEEKLLAEFSVNTGLTHSQTMMPMAQAALDCAKLTLHDIDAFAVAAGPGSFTGLRIGIAAVKGLAQTLGKPCVPVSTLEGLAQNLQGFEATVCAVMDARCKQVYNALFTCGGTPSRLCEDRAISIEQLTQELKTVSDRILLVGDGAELCYAQMHVSLPQVELAPVALRHQKASSVALCAHRLYAQGVRVEAGELIPTYLRLSQAERQLQEKKRK